jgi:cysteine desulfurase
MEKLMKAYLDNSATTRPDDRVIEKMAACMREGYFNPSSVYAPAVSALRAVRECREEILNSVRGADCKLVFTSGGTEANNLAILGTAEKMRGLCVAAVSAVEHPSVLAPYEALSARGVDVRLIGVSESGELDFLALEKALDDGAKLVSVMQVNNETGALNDIRRVHTRIDGRALLHVDGVQGYLRVPFEMKDCELYTLSAHKIHGPKGVGALIYKNGVRLAARAIGGGQEENLRSGTENTPGIAGLREAARIMGDCDMGALMEMKRHLIAAFREAVPGLLINGPDPESAASHIVSLSFPGVRGEVLLHALEAEGIYASTGSACSSKKTKVSKVLLAMGVPAARAESALRFSISPHTAREEIDYAAGKLQKIYGELKRFQRR